LSPVCSTNFFLFTTTSPNQRTMKTTRTRFPFFICLLVFALSLSGLRGGAALDIARNFASPPDEARPWVYWFWSNGNITREGITADLEAMKRTGIGGVLIMEVDQSVPAGPVRMMTGEWRGMFAFAAAEARRLGLELIMNNGPGWTGAGGPWNTPENSMQKVVWTEHRVRGPAKFDAKLAQPETIENYYREIAVLAFPTPAAETQPMRGANPSITTNTAAPDADLPRLVDDDRTSGFSLPRLQNPHEWPWVQLAFAQPREANLFEVVAAFAGRGEGGEGAEAGRVLCELLVSDDGRDFREVTRMAANSTPVTFAPVKARFFRVVFSGNSAALDNLRLNEIVLATAFRTADVTNKSGLGAAVSTVNVREVAEARVAPRDKVLDISAHLRDGRLQWDVPEGDWTILRFGHTSTGQENFPAPVEARGLEVDKLSAAALDIHFDAFLGKLIKDADAAGVGAGTFAGVHIDSWEVGFQNWTPRFRAEFERLRGYDPLPWLPAFTGRAVDGAAMSERFLWDVRRTISDLLNENHAGRMAARARAHGRYLSLEGYDNGPFDPLPYTGRADLPVGEFWMTPDPGDQHASIKMASSAGHIYGKNIIGAEAFTALDTFSRHQLHPYSVKAFGDAAFCSGINHFIVHRYSLQPWVDDRKPGMTMGPWGWEYERTATWWEQSGPWHEYLARCQYMLRQGLFVADICYLQDEEGFKRLPGRQDLQPRPPRGSDYDLCSAEVVLTRMSVKDGRLVLPDGMSYRVLVLPRQRLMTPVLLRKIRGLVRDGATVLGAPPLRAPGLQNYPSCDEEVRGLVAEIWGDCDGVRVKERKFGKGRVIWGLPLAEVLSEADAGAGPDFVYRHNDARDNNTAPAAPAQHAARLQFIHRATPEMEIYFVANLDAIPADVTASFRVKALQPQLWRPECGTIEDAPVYDCDDTHTRMPLHLGPRESVFVVFEKKRPADSSRITKVTREGRAWLDTEHTDRPARATGAARPEAAAGAATYPLSDYARHGIAGSFTYAVWVKPARDMPVPAEDFSGTEALYLRTRNDLLFPPEGQLRFRNRNAVGTGLSVGKNVVCVLERRAHHFVATLVHPVSIEDWTHLAVVFRNGRPSLYINGRLVRTGLRSLFDARGATAEEEEATAFPLETAHAFDGEHSELKLFNRALDEAEIRDLMRTMPKEPAATGATVAPAAEFAVNTIAPDEAAPAGAPAPILRVSLENGKPVVWTTEPGRYETRQASGRVTGHETGPVPEPRAITGPWLLRFPEGWGAPPAVELPALIPWSEHAEPGVKYFSGTAIYEKNFTLPPALRNKNQRLLLDLGNVQVIARVTLNGRDLGTLWKPPFLVDITEAVRDGSNTLEIAVTNTWVNRLIGDEQLPPDREWTRVARRRGLALKEYPDWFLRGERSPVGRVTFTTWKHYDKDAPLHPSGLIGPVLLRPLAKAQRSQP